MKTKIKTTKIRNKKIKCLIEQIHTYARKRNTYVLMKTDILITWHFENMAKFMANFTNCWWGQVVFVKISSSTNQFTLLINSSTNTILPLLINQTPQNKTSKLLIILVFFKKRKVFQPEVLLLKYLKLNSWISRNKRSLLPVNQPYHMTYPWFVLLFMRLPYHLFSTAPAV